MKTLIISALCIVVLLCGVAGAVPAQEILVGTAYFLDKEGVVFAPYSGEGELQDNLPVILLVEAEVRDDDDEGEAVIYYQQGGEPRIEEGSIRELKGVFYMSGRLFEIEAPEIGKVQFAHSGEVLVDEIWGEMGSYRVQALGEWYTAVGVIALEEFQETEEGREAFQEIIGDLREDIRDGREQ